MKLVRTTKERFIFEIGRREKRLLLELLRHYPAVPPAHQRVTRSISHTIPDAQHLLDASLAEQRAAHRKQLEAMLGQPDRFTPTARGYEFMLTPSDVEWLLQVLNDIRLGHWIRLGSPGAEVQPLKLRLEEAVGYSAMEASGYFQMALLHALEAEGAD